MSITRFEDLLRAATEQSEPQRLLFVFVTAQLPDDASDEERQRFAQGQGGTLKPVLCVDKLPEEIGDFSALVAESAHTGVGWELVFVAGLAGRAGIAPNPDEAEQPLKMMVAAIENGGIGSFLAFDRDGQTVAFY